MAAVAQSREVYIGSTGRNSEGRPAYGERQGYGDTAAAQMLGAAQEELSRGRVFDARRILEAVIERFPDSRPADDARRLLAPIYGANQHRTSPQVSEPPPLSQPMQQRNDAWRDAATQPPNQLEPAPMPRNGNALRPAMDPRQLRMIVQDYRSNVADRVFFGDASVEIGAKSRAVLAAQAQWLSRNAQLPITIEAHADDQGSHAFNEQLARQRAEAVRVRLIEEGIEPSRIRVSVRGRESPIASCPDPACAVQNRRVVTVVGDASVGQQLRPGNTQGR